jgi:hypothetical protein
MNIGEYYLYLTDRVSRGGARYNLLLSYLFETPFRWSYKIPTDANRAKDGQLLRDRYANDTGDYILYEDKRERCNVLEMMVALSIRIEEDITGEPGDDHPERWFWEMIENLGLNKFSDRSFDERRVNDILNKWMLRSFRDNGEGGLFPLKHPLKDQRLVPIWDQMNLYLNERLKGDFEL